MSPRTAWVLALLAPFAPLAAAIAADAVLAKLGEEGGVIDTCVPQPRQLVRALLKGTWRLVPHRTKYGDTQWPYPRKTSCLRCGRAAYYRPDPGEHGKES